MPGFLVFLELLLSYLATCVLYSLPFQLTKSYPFTSAR